MRGQFGLTSLAMVVMKAGGLAVAIRERAWRAERAESAGGLRGKPTVTLWREKVSDSEQKVLPLRKPVETPTEDIKYNIKCIVSFSKFLVLSVIFGVVKNR